MNSYGTPPKMRCLEITFSIKKISIHPASSMALWNQLNLRFTDVDLLTSTAPHQNNVLEGVDASEIQAMPVQFLLLSCRENDTYASYIDSPD